MPDRAVRDKPWRLQACQTVEVFLAEVVGTGMLVFFVCMAQVKMSPDEELHPLQGAIVTAVVVATIIQIFGHISNAHINPSVTVAFLVLGQITPFMALVYVISEIVGAILGYGLLMCLTPSKTLDSASTSLCCTLPHPGLSDTQAVAVEFFATCLLVMVVCACADPRNSDKLDSVPLKFGCTLLTLCITVGPFTGASMNPARSLAPALWTGTWDSQWIYWLGPLLSGLFSALFYQAVFSHYYRPQLSSIESEPLNQVDAGSPKYSREHKEKSLN